MRVQATNNPEVSASLQRASIFNMDEKQENKLFTELGYIKKWLETIDKKIERQNAKVSDIQNKVQKHEVFLGKVGAGIAGITFIATVVFSALINALLKFWK